jgi:hypothetical protein
MEIAKKDIWNFILGCDKQKNGALQDSGWESLNEKITSLSHDIYDASRGVNGSCGHEERQAIRMKLRRYAISLIHVKKEFHALESSFDALSGHSRTSILMMLAKNEGISEKESYEKYKEIIDEIYREITRYGEKLKEVLR